MAAAAQTNNRMNHTLLKKMITTELTSGEEQDFSYMIEGPHGIGKSAIIKEIALEFDAYLIDMRLGQRDLGDVLGMPHTFLINNVPHFGHIKPDLIRAAFEPDITKLGLMGDANDVLAKSREKEKVGKPYQYVFFFADEYNRGTKDVQQSMFELVYDRRMSGEKLAEHTWVFAACNDNMDVYTVTEGDPAFRSRFKTIKYTPTVDEWRKWGKESGELCPELLHVFSVKKDLADPPASKNGEIDYLNNPHPNRRSWHHFSHFYTLHKNSFNESEMRDICATFVGSEAAEVFKLLVIKMKETQTKHDAAVNVEDSKIKELYAQFIQFHKMDKNLAKEKLSKFNPSEMNAFADLCIEQLSKFKFITSATKDCIIELSEIINQETFAKIWNGVNDQYNFKAKMITHAITHAQTKGIDLTKYNKI